ncbi:MAG: membrane protein insertion efficiency factor YidD [Proteobacteria bacterium]|nr:MAG: membrane protein insertion efficiency factor YidD [Pseudomonadota bacterium]
MKHVLLWLIRGYQLILSPVIGANCRHEPSCSRYSFEAIQRFGVIKGVWLTFNRVRKCHPWGTWGYDPVPPRILSSRSPQSPSKKRFRDRL